MINFEQQLFPENQLSVKPLALCAQDTESKRLEPNVQRQVQKLEASSCAPSAQTSTLKHLFKQGELTSEQVHDLMNFRDIGQHGFERNIDYYILRTPSVQPPKHRKSLLTFTERRSRKKKGSDIERERKLQLECWKKRVAFAATQGAHINSTYEQYIELPRAIATIDGRPVKGNKANTTNVLKKRYENAASTITTPMLKPGWTADTVVMEGMFLINITPLTTHHTVGEYAEFLMKQYILRQFWNMAKESTLTF